MQDIKGTPVSEGEVASGLGFANVLEFRRWQTEQGKRVWEIQEELRKAENDRDNFRWHVMRMHCVLENCYEYLKKDLSEQTPEMLRKIILAVGTQINKEIDWKNELTGLFAAGETKRKAEREQWEATKQKWREEADKEWKEIFGCEE